MNAALQEMCDAYSARLAGRSGELCQRHPQGDAQAWSMQDVVEHLVLTYRGSVAHTEKYLKRGLPTTRRADWKQRSARWVVIGLGIFPRGTQAPEFVSPGRSGMAAMNGDELGLLLREELGKVDEVLAGCEAIFGEQTFAAHFRLGPLSARQWRRFHLVHGWHHLAQLERIEERVGLPSGE